ncbi:unnamed protein product [Tenebrio molitor]|nr:unnamed protein product [Tenebrio molitor]
MKSMIVALFFVLAIAFTYARPQLIASSWDGGLVSPLATPLGGGLIGSAWGGSPLVGAVW